MKSCVLVIIALQSALCDKTKEQKLIVPVMSELCKNIQCSTVEDPRCVKIRHLKDPKRIIYIIVVNKCEIQYVKCHQDYNAKIVPMKQCGHEFELNSKKKKMINTTDHIRSKREIQPSTTVTKSSKLIKKTQMKEEKKDASKTKLNKNRRHRIGGQRRIAANLRDSDYSDYEGEGGHKVYISRNIKVNRLKRPARQDMEGQAGFLIRKEDVYDESVVWPLLAEDEVRQGHSGYKVKPEEVYDENELWNSDVDILHAIEHMNLDQDHHHHHHHNRVEEDTEFPLISKESVNTFNDVTKKPNMQYEENCPDFCPSRRVMVCARCQHGVYKTFISVCHMRMFTCMYNEEVLQLVSRYPCILSAPYISGKGMSPQGHVQEVTDDDTVLRFIKCRGYGRLKHNVSDPRCQFETGLPADSDD